MNKKFELTSITIEWKGRKLFRIKALKSFSGVKAGELGGYIESENNLSQDGNSWIYDDAKVYDNAKIFGNAHVRNNAEVFGNAKVYDDAEVFGNAKVCANANIKEDGWVSDYSIILGSVCVYGNSWVYGNAEIHDNAEICGNVKVCGDVGIIVTNGTTREDYTNAQIALAKKWGYPYINLNGDERTPAMIRCWNSNMSEELKTKLAMIQGADYPSNTHPNAKAHEYESTFIEAWMRTL